MSFRRAINVDAKKVWLSDAGTYPVIASIVVAVAWCAASCTRYLVLSPDVHWDRKERCSPVRENHDEGASWSHHKYSKIAKNVETIGLFGAVEKKYADRS